jgi:phosphohistidine swiveling domain-containing protein
MKKKFITKEKLTFPADKVSGYEACLFVGSIVLEVIIQNNKRNFLHFPFYADTYDLNGFKASEWIIEKEYKNQCQKLVKHLQKNGLAHFQTLKKKSLKESELFRKYTLKVIKRVADLTDEQILDLYHQFIKKYVYYFGLGAITFIYEDILSKKLHQSLAERYPEAVEIMSQALKTTYTSLIFQSEASLYKIKKEKNKKKKERLIKMYLENFFYIKANYHNAPMMDKQQIEKEVKRFSPKVLSKINQVKKINNTYFTKEEKNLIQLFKLTEVIHDQRKKVNQIGNYGLLRFFDEAKKRQRLVDDISNKIFWFEYDDLITNPDKLIRNIKNRKAASIVLAGKKSYYFDYLALTEKGLNKNIRLISGTPASKGQVIGQVSVILGSRDFIKFKKGQILVTEMTRPEFIQIIKKSKAIITDEGGLTCHAAIVARELKIPCMVGSKIATKVLKDGDLVEVDANQGVVKIIKK